MGLGDEAGIFQREEGSLRSQGKGKTGMLGSVGMRLAMVQGENRQHLLLHQQGDEHPGTELPRIGWHVLQDVQMRLDETGIRAQVVHNHRLAQLAGCC